MLSEDSKQMLTGMNTFFVEFYKILCGCFLILFVPQKCDDGICSITDNYNRNDVLNKVGLSFNLVSFVLFMGIYFVELKREKYCIDNLDIDADKPNNNLDDEIEEYPKLKKDLKSLNKHYYNLSIINVCSQIINIALSSVVIYENNYGAITTTPLISYILLVLNKLYYVYFISDTSLKEERMYSAYLTINKTFNTVDIDYINKKKNIGQSNVEIKNLEESNSNEDSEQNAEIRI